MGNTKCVKAYTLWQWRCEPVFLPVVGPPYIGKRPSGPQPNLARGLPRPCVASSCCPSLATGHAEQHSVQGDPSDRPTSVVEMKREHVRACVAAARRAHTGHARARSSPPLWQPYPVRRSIPPRGLRTASIGPCMSVQCGPPVRHSEPICRRQRGIRPGLSSSDPLMTQAMSATR